jgi:hypothetical protein
MIVAGLFLVESESIRPSAASRKAREVLLLRWLERPGNFAIASGFNNIKLTINKCGFNGGLMGLIPSP